MEGKQLGIAKLDASADADDFNYIRGLSTILVATIQEVKDRVSQIEFIFCSQLFPNFQSKSKLFQTRLASATKSVEDEWKKKEASLLSQLEELHGEKQHANEQLQKLGSFLEETRMKLTKTEQLAAEHDLEKKQLLGKLEDQMRKEETIAGLKRELEQRTGEVVKEIELHQRLQRQIELKDNELLLEQSRRRDLTKDYNKLKTNYKHLKSQYIFLIGKIDKSADCKLHVDSAEVERRSQSPLKKRSFRDLEEINKDDVQVISKSGELKNGASSCAKPQPNQEFESAKSLYNNSRLPLPSRSTVLPPKDAPSHPKPKPLSGVKQSSSYWRETRMRQEADGVDPHDDFLNTPMEVVRNLKRISPEEAQALPGPPPQDMDFNNSDDETQDISVVTQRLNEATVPMPQNFSHLQSKNKDFKYVEPVRKKAEREKLKGIECKQCKKFYDAVLPDDRGNGDDVSSTSMRCEHHDGISRHRYRYAPPMTPEGFWNIGFESET